MDSFGIICGQEIRVTGPLKENLKMEENGNAVTF